MDRGLRLRDMLVGIILASIFFLGIREWGVEAFHIPTSSMERTLVVGDFLLVKKFSYWLRDPEFGDVIVFRSPPEPEKNYVKRVVGMPGDTIEMHNKLLMVNGELLVEPYVHYEKLESDAVHPGMGWQSNHLIASTSGAPTRDNWGPIVVPSESYFVLGDNRDNSSDSRYWGFVPRGSLVGSPWFIYFSKLPGAAKLKGIRWKRIGNLIE